MVKTSLEKYDRIYDQVNNGKNIRTDVIYVTQGLPNCGHPILSQDNRDEIVKCILCDMCFMFQSQKQFNKFRNRIIFGFDFVTKKLNDDSRNKDQKTMQKVITEVLKNNK